MRKCSKCQKEINSGKFYRFYTGKKGKKRLLSYKGKEFFCPSCAEKEKAEDEVYLENLLQVEWEVGNQTDEQILEFEEKWENAYSEDELVKHDDNTSEQKILAWCQKVKKELEPFLQKPEIVEKSFGGKLDGYGKSSMIFYYLFSQSARNENYRKAVVEPTIAEIFGVNKLNQEINTTITGEPGVHGRADGNFKISNQYQVDYNWLDGPQVGYFRRIWFEVFDPKLALQSFYRALKIKEKELKNDQNDQQPKPNQLPPSNPLQKNDNPSPPKSPENKNRTLIISLVIGGVIILAGGIVAVIFWRKKHSPKN